MKNLTANLITSLFLAVPVSMTAQNVPTANIFNRVMQIKYGEETGTAFTIEVDDRQYLITARHILVGWKTNDVLSVKNGKDWKPITVNLLDSNTNSDVAVLIPQQQLTTAFPAPPTTETMMGAQDIFFLGYPYGLFFPIGDFNLAWTKKGILSAEVLDTNGISHIYLDGHNNPGFSGGPMVFKSWKDSEWHIAGVVSGYLWVANHPVNAVDTNSFMKENTGIVIGENIASAVQAIKLHPVGPKVTRN